MRQLQLFTYTCACAALLLMAAFNAPAAWAAPAAHAAPAAASTDDADDEDDSGDTADTADDAAAEQLGNCATLGEAVRRFALARDHGLAKMDAFKSVTLGKSSYVPGSLVDQTLEWPYDHPAEQAITTASHFYHRCVLDALDSLDPATERELADTSMSCQQRNPADPDAIDACIAARTDDIVDRYHGNAPPAVTLTPASAVTPFSFITETPLIASAPKPGARVRSVAAPPKAVLPLEPTPAIASAPVFAQPQAAPLVAAVQPPKASPAAEVAPPPLEATPDSASAIAFAQPEAATLLAAVPKPAATLPAQVAAPTVPLEDTPATASTPAYTQTDAAVLLAATSNPAAPPVEVAAPPAPVPTPQPAPLPAPQPVVAAPQLVAAAPAPVAPVAAVAAPAVPMEVAAPAPVAVAKAAPMLVASGSMPASVDAYGKLKLGMPLLDSIKSFHGYPDVEKDEQGATTYVFLVGDGNAFITLRTSPTHPGELYGIQVTGGPEGKQAPVAGVLLGDTAADLVAKVGQPAARTPVQDYHTVWSYSGRNYSFEVSDGGDVISLLIYGYAGTPEEQPLGQDGTGDGSSGLGQ